MPWEFSDDVRQYADRTWELLTADPVRNTVALTVIETVRAGGRWGSGAMTFGWQVDRTGRVDGAVSMTPPYEMLLAAVPDGGVDELVGALRAEAPTIGGVNGDVGTVQQFGAAWTAATTLRVRTTMRQRLYALGSLEPPAPPPPGHARRAGDADTLLALEWLDAFQAADGGGHRIDNLPGVRDRIAQGMLWLWEDDRGRAVSLAGRRPAVAGVSRVGPVYTPTEDRRRGYGAAVTAAVTRAALDEEAAAVVLFTDLANPTSNAIYQRLGYRPVRDRLVVRFD